MKNSYVLVGFVALSLGMVGCDEEPEQDSALAPVERVERAVQQELPELPGWLDVSSVRVRSFGKSIGVLVVVLPEEPIRFEGHGLHPSRAEALKELREVRRLERADPRRGTRFFGIPGVRSSFCYRNRVEGAICHAAVGRSALRVEIGNPIKRNVAARLTEVVASLAPDIENSWVPDVPEPHPS